VRYLLPAEHPAHGQPWSALDSVRADSKGCIILRGRAPTPDVYWLRAGRTELPPLGSLSNQQQRLTGRVAKAAGSTCQAPVYRLLPGGSPEVVLLQVMPLYVVLRSRPAPAGDAALRCLQQLRQQASSYLAPYLAYTYLRPQPQAWPLPDSLTTCLPASSPPPLPVPPAGAAGRAPYPGSRRPGSRLYPA
jgi:hypothetical protein